MQANIRDQQEQSSSSIFYEGLQLLMECKVPDFSSLVDPDDRTQMQRGWSERLLDCLTEFVDFLERHQETLFFEDCGLVSGEFRKHFLLVYFEQVTQAGEYGWFQMHNEPGRYIEIRLEAFSSIIESILYEEAGTSTDFLDWLVRRYRTSMDMEGWPDRGEEVYSFVRLLYFLADFDHRDREIKLAPKILENLAAVAESFLESIKSLQRSSKQTRSLIRSVSVQVMATHYALENLNRTLKCSIDAAEKLQSVGEN